jgi:hypothetical protein
MEPAAHEGQRRQRIVDALLNSFPNKGELTHIVSLALEQKLEHIVGAGSGRPLREVAFDLVDWTDARGLTAVLVCKAFHERPANPLMRAVAVEFQCPESQAARSPWPVTTAPPLDAGDSAPDTTRPAHQRIAVWALIGLLGSVGIEWLNRRHLHLMQLYAFMETAGGWWTFLAALSGFLHVRAPSRRWGLGVTAAVACAVMFFIIDIALIRTSVVKPEQLQWFLPFFYGFSFGALAWSVVAGFAHGRTS